MKRIYITEADPKYKLGLAPLLMQDGAVPVVFEVADDYDLDSYHGLALYEPLPALGTPSAPMLQTKFPEVAAWLEAYTGNFDFYRSLKAQFIAKGMLSDKQIACIQRAIDKDKAEGRTIPTAAPQVFDLKPGTVLIVSKFIATKIAEKAGYARAHRAVEVLAVEAETPKAYLCEVKLSARRTSHCGICGLTLENAQSIAAGIGPICADNYGLPYGEASLEGLQAALQTAATVKTWIPKKSIKERKES